MKVDLGIEWRIAKQALWIITPLMIAGWTTQNSLWFHSGLVALSTFIGVSRAGLPPLGVLIQAITIELGFLLLFFSQLVPILFVLIAALLAAAAVWFAAPSIAMRKLANFTFISSLYIACESAEKLPVDLYFSTVVDNMIYIALGAVPSCLFALTRFAPHLKGSRGAFHRLWWVCWSASFGRRKEQGLVPLCATLLGVLIAAGLVEWVKLEHGQWVIWSAVSVMATDLASTRLALRNRLVGIATGLPIGLAAATILPPANWIYELAVLSSALLLVSRQKFLPGFSIQCACLVVAFSISTHSLLIAAQRGENVILGGAIGVFAYVVCHYIIQAISIRY